ncbi:MAG TPA: hypothetical protein VFI28_13555 [Candidatus Limnocylindrales bacterium]|nr:hypothetical protein [Candidatus Limnocylindrales bacterium]
MNDVPRRPRPPAGPGADGGPEAAPPELASVDQTALAPTERRFGEGLRTDGPNMQGSTPLRVARPSDPGATPGIEPGVAAEGAAEVAATAATSLPPRHEPVEQVEEDDDRSPR